MFLLPDAHVATIGHILLMKLLPAFNVISTIQTACYALHHIITVHVRKITIK